VRFKDRSVTPIRVGLDQVGIVGLQEALKATEGLDPEDRERVVDRMMEELGPRNYIPESQVDAYRTAFWREFQRHRGEDFSAWYSELPVAVRGVPGDERDRFVALVATVLAGHELRAVVTFADGGREPELVIRGEVVARGSQNRASLERAVRRTFSHW
jgi:hypothetical protein